MALIMLIGPPAVGKMTVGQELERLLGYKLFHNHVAIEVVTPYFSYGTKRGRSLVYAVRQAFFDAFAADTDGSYIFTFMWAFGKEGERSYIEGVAQTMADKGHEIYWVELETDLDTRLARNRTENRLAHKATKRNLDWSDRNVQETAEQYRLNSQPGEMPYEHYLRLDNTDRSATEIAQEICRHFGLTPS